jgi:hypothetical protein
MLISDPGGATITGFEARNTVNCIACPAGVVAMLENAKTTVGAWNILEITVAMTGCLFIANPAVMMVRQNAQIAGFSLDDVHMDGMRICKMLPIERRLLVLDTTGIRSRPRALGQCLRARASSISWFVTGPSSSPMARAWIEVTTLG